MTTLTVDGKQYRIEFRHITKLGKRRQLYDRAPIKAITTCVISADDFMAIDNSICADADNFSRALGRDRAFNRALQHCGALRDVAGKLFAEYVKATVPPKTAAPVRNELSDEEVRQKILSGAEKRAARALHRPVRGGVASVELP